MIGITASGWKPENCISGLRLEAKKMSLTELTEITEVKYYTSYAGGQKIKTLIIKQEIENF